MKTYYHIHPSTPGWYKVLDKHTGACMDNVKGYQAALAVYRRLNKARKSRRGR